MRHYIEVALQDVRFGARMLAKNPGFTAAAVLTLAVSIGANSAIFSTVNAVLLRVLPFNEPDRLVRLYAISKIGALEPTSWADLADWQEQSESFEYLAGFEAGNETLSGTTEPEYLASCYAGPGFFQVFEVNPIYGRHFLPEEHVKNAAPVVAVGELFWKRRLASDPNVLGRPLTINGAPVTVVAVYPDRFDTIMKRRVELWFPAKPDSRRGIHFLPVIGRLKPNATVSKASAEMTSIAARLGQSYPDSNGGWGAAVVPLKESIVGDLRLMLLVLLGAVGLILLIACANVANLLLAKAASRTNEIAIRTAVGASRGRLIRQLLTEGLMLSLSGGLLGLFFGNVATQVFSGLNPGGIPRLEEADLDLNVIGFTLLLSLGTTFIFGMIPAVRLSEAGFNEALRGIGRGIKGSRSQNAIRNILVVSELAISLVVLIGCGLLMRSFYRLQSVNPGFNADGVFTAQTPLRDSKYVKPEMRRIFYDELVERTGSLPGAESVAVSSTLPVNGGGPDPSWDVIPEGLPENEDGIPSRYRRVSPGYFHTMQIPILDGRDFDGFDGRNNQNVIILSQSLAQQLWPDQSSVGKRVIIGETDHQVVGVVGNVKTWGLDSSDITAAYAPLPQDPPRFMIIVVRTASANLKPGSAIKSMVSSIDKDLPVINVRTLEEVVGSSLAVRRFYLFLSTIFAGLALLLASIGTYSVIAYSVVERTREIGLRMALGASTKNVISLVVGQAARLSIIGVVFGIAAAFALTRITESLLFMVSYTDPTVFAASAAFLLVMAFFASYLPARRASGIEPMSALRVE